MATDIPVREFPVQPLSLGMDDAANVIGLTRAMMYQLIARGDIDSFKIGRRRLILVKELNAYINRAAKENAR